MEENTIDFYIAIPSYDIEGDAIDENVLDGFIEQFNVDQIETKVLENENNFYVFTDVLPLNFKEVNNTVKKSKELVKIYNDNVSYLTKLLRNEDRYQDQLNKLVRDIEKLKKENAILKEKKEEALNLQETTIGSLKKQ